MYACMTLLSCHNSLRSCILDVRKLAHGYLRTASVQCTPVRSILSTHMALQLLSITSRIFSWKLSLLHKVYTECDSLGHKGFCVPSSNSSHDCFLVQKCHSLKEKLVCHGMTQKILDRNPVGRHGMAKLVAEADWNK